MSSSFPPSSPFLDQTTNDEYDPFAATQLHTKNEAQKKLVINSPFISRNEEATPTPKGFSYPTPNPSSVTGARSSSPARQPQANYSPLGEGEGGRDQLNTNSSPTTSKQVPSAVENSKVKYLNPLDSALRVRLYSNLPVELGRSSRCEYFIRSKFASRRHLKLKYDNETNELSVLCKGYNGVTIVLGEKYYGYIRELDGNLFRFIKKTKEDVTDEEEIFSEIVVFKNEQIVLPYNERLSLDIKGFKVLLDVIDDVSETEDELPVLNTLERTSSALSLISEGAEVEVEAEETPEESRDAVERMKTVELAEESIQNETLTPVAEEDSAKSSISDTISNTEPLPKTKTTQAREPLAIKTESHLNQDSSLQQRRRKAEPGLSPQKKKIDHTSSKGKKYIDPREKIQSLNVEEILPEIAANHDLDSIMNVLVNHLAFSRLSQTPLQQLQTVSQSIQALSRYQLRAVLVAIKCIGVIYRHGKDAAGKPLDEEYYYDVERDTDLERTKLVSSIKGSSGLRNCRKTHKQYFWKRPVNKK
jgi:pSer/pThr/pTyr-binding forkhead associated (FHA) protein